MFRNQLTLETVDVPLTDQHTLTDALRIVQLSDLHYLPFTTLTMIEEAVAAANQLKPDLILLTGDYVTHEADTIFGMTQSLRRLNARYGVFGVLGNHDTRAGARIVRDGLAEAGVTLLNNRGVTLATASGHVNLAGVDDCLWGHPNLAKALEGLDPHAPTVLLAHEPDVIDKFSLDGRITLQLSGHTHGGQVHLPVLGTPVLPRLGEKYVKGLFRVHDSYLYVTRGVGMVSLPIRFNCPAEITQLTLQPSRPSVHLNGAAGAGQSAHPAQPQSAPDHRPPSH